MKFLKKPCKQCPFVKGAFRGLHPERVEEISDAVLYGHNFHCHKTVDYDVEDEDSPNTSESSLCFGSLQFAAKNDDALFNNPLVRVAYRFKELSDEILEKGIDKVFDDQSEMIEYYENNR